MPAAQKKREKEKLVIEWMILLYCRRKHRAKNGLCTECEALKEYAFMRSDNCPFMETKTFCSCCRVHCYSAGMREKIKLVMRYSGPRMLLYHPLLAFRHTAEMMKEKRRQR